MGEEEGLSEIITVQPEGARVVSGRNFESEEKRSSLTDVFIIVSSPY